MRGRVRTARLAREGKALPTEAGPNIERQEADPLTIRSEVHLDQRRRRIVQLDAANDRRVVVDVAHSGLEAHLLLYAGTKRQVAGSDDVGRIGSQPLEDTVLVPDEELRLDRQAGDVDALVVEKHEAHFGDQERGAAEDVRRAPPAAPNLRYPKWRIDAPSRR